MREFEVVTLPDELAFLFLFQGPAFPCLLGRLSLGPREAPMHGAAIFELGRTLLDSSLLDLEFSQSRRGGGQGEAH